MTIERVMVADTVPILRLTGELDLSNVPEVRRAIRALIEEEQLRFVINLTQLEFIDSSGLGVLVGGLARVREKQGDIKLAIGNRRIMRVFEMTRLTQLFDIYEDEESAINRLKEEGGDQTQEAA